MREVLLVWEALFPSHVSKRHVLPQNDRIQIQHFHVLCVPKDFQAWLVPREKMMLLIGPTHFDGRGTNL